MQWGRCLAYSKPSSISTPHMDPRTKNQKWLLTAKLGLSPENYCVAQYKNTFYKIMVKNKFLQKYTSYKHVNMFIVYKHMYIIHIWENSLVWGFQLKMCSFCVEITYELWNSRANFSIERTESQLLKCQPLQNQSTYFSVLTYSVCSGTEKTRIRGQNSQSIPI